jgi:hypothetical protein
MGKSVTYNDYLRFNYLTGLALIENDTVTLTEEDIEFLASETNEEGGFVATTFEGMYFTAPENEWIDSACKRLSQTRLARSGLLKSALGHHALFQACLAKRPFNLFHRKNLYLRRARIKRTFGNKRTWDRPFADHIRDFASEANRMVFEGEGECRATCYEVSRFPSGQYDFVYLDPPYLRRDGSHETADYRRCYHFLEGIANYSRWPEMVDHRTSNLRLSEEQTNMWCDPEKSAAALDELLGSFPNSIFAMSYRKYGVPSLSTLMRLLKRHGRKVSIHTRHYKYALNHQNGDAHFNREALILGTRG